MEITLQETIVKDVEYVGKIENQEILDIYLTLTGGESIAEKYDGAIIDDEILGNLKNNISYLRNFISRAKETPADINSVEAISVGREGWERDSKTLLLFLTNFYEKAQRNRGTEINIGGI